MRRTPKFRVGHRVRAVRGPGHCRCQPEPQYLGKVGVVTEIVTYDRLEPDYTVVFKHGQDAIDESCLEAV